MRSIPTVLLLALLAGALVAPALAQAPEPNAPPPGPCGRGGFGGGGAGGGGGGFRGNRTGNFTGGARGEPWGNVTLAFDPADPLVLPPGATAVANVTVQNAGSDPASMELLSPSFGRRNQTPMIEASVAPANLTLDAGGSAVATVSLAVSPDVPAGCRLMVTVIARETGGNRTAFARLAVDTPAADAQPAADQTAPKKTPLALEAPLAALALAAVATRGRAGGRRP